MTDNEPAATQKSARILQWWQEAHWTPWLNDSSGEDLRNAFVTVLTAMPDDLFQDFLSIAPRVLRAEGAMAMALAHSIPRESTQGDPGPTGGRPLTLILFNIELGRQTQGALLFLVAHEIAHVVLHHLHPSNGKSCEDREAQANDHAKRWGFHRPWTFDHFDLNLRLERLRGMVAAHLKELGKPDDDGSHWRTHRKRCVQRLGFVLEDLDSALLQRELDRACATAPLIHPSVEEVAAGAGRPAKSAIRVPRTPLLPDAPRTPRTPLL